MFDRGVNRINYTIIKKREREYLLQRGLNIIIGTILKKIIIAVLHIYLFLWKRIGIIFTNKKPRPWIHTLFDRAAPAPVGLYNNLKYFLKINPDP